MRNTSKTKSPIAWVLGETGDHGGQYVLSVILAVFGVAFSIAPYFVVIGIVQGLMSGVTDFTFYLNRCVLMAGFWLGRVLCHAFSTATSHRATFAVLGEIRKRCMEKLTRMPLGAVLEQSSGALKNTLIERIDSIETTLAHIVPEFTANLLIPVVIIIYLHDRLEDGSCKYSYSSAGDVLLCLYDGRQHKVLSKNCHIYQGS